MTRGRVIGTVTHVGKRYPDGTCDVTVAVGPPAGDARRSVTTMTLWDQVKEQVRHCGAQAEVRDVLLNLIALCEKQEARIEELEERVAAAGRVAR